jgi:AcrR family transcriptional regulator
MSREADRLSGQDSTGADGRGARATPPRARRRTGRRPGSSGTREDILRAARQRFADYGYAGATIRGIAADANVGAALVHHFYGTKEQLFAAAMRLPVLPSELLAAAAGPGPGRSAEGLGEKMVRVALAAWGAQEIREAFLGLLRSAVTDERALRMLREFVTETIISVIAGTMGEQAAPEEAAYRASLVASQMVGLAVGLYLLELDPLAGASADDLVAAIGPTIQRYLTGAVRVNEKLSRSGRTQISWWGG